MKNVTCPGGVPPRLPAFAGKSPPAAPLTPLLHEQDLVIVSLAGKPPEPITCGRFRSLLFDEKSEGSVHIGEKGRIVKIASFAQFRSYIFGPAGPVGHSASK